MARIAVLSIAMLACGPVLAALDDEPLSDTYSGLCTMDAACDADGHCTRIPALGELVIRITPEATRMGRPDEETLDMIDHYPTLDAALPLPALDNHRRSFLTDAPAEGAARRFHLHVQIAEPAPGQPALSPRHFRLTCFEAPA
ncbi:hypothetical protein [Hasllibacter sp. MH4015]|uniref:hypothetical protein n=1 Tax=Hasllibacter sp. MH4015 TaxID=2854029 RepID=UPI001CD3FA96|nr:hypothetical protein [Hasllibacter sp. MH4015]